jgi:hypothetical protein
MTDSTTLHTWMTRLARRISSSSGARLPLASFASCVLHPLGQARPQAYTTMESVI